MLDIYVDADGCPVKTEVYRVARRYGLKVFLVANTWMQAPAESFIEQVVVDDQFDAADDWIAEHAAAGDIVISADIPLAARCLANDARVLGPRGRLFTEDHIGEALANRDVAAQLREMGIMTGGPKPFARRDRSRFLQSLDQVVQAIRRGR